MSTVGAAVGKEVEGVDLRVVRVGLLVVGDFRLNRGWKLLDKEKEGQRRLVGEEMLGKDYATANGGTDARGLLSYSWREWIQ